MKDSYNLTNNRRRCITHGYLVSLIFPQFFHEPQCVVWELFCEQHKTCVDFFALIIGLVQFGDLL